MYYRHRFSPLEHEPGTPSPSTSRSSTTAEDCTTATATAPRSTQSSNIVKQRPLPDQQPEELSKIVDTAHLWRSATTAVVRRQLGGEFAAYQGVDAVENVATAEGFGQICIRTGGEAGGDGIGGGVGADDEYGGIGAVVGLQALA